MAVLTTITISIGGLVEIVPMFALADDPNVVRPLPYTPLEVAGRDIYVREGCMVCHSQMVRPFRDETLRYGEWSHASEYTWDRPFLLGSRRIGPDLHRVGGKYPDAWHVEHMKNPRSTSPGSIMPAYAWLLDWRVDPNDVRQSLVALRTLGTPYDDALIDDTEAALRAEAAPYVKRLADAKVDLEWDTEIIALTAYLQRLGTDRPKPVAAAEGEK